MIVQLKLNLSQVKFNLRIKKLDNYPSQIKFF